LEKVNNQWVMRGCLGSSLLDEIGLSRANSLDKSQIIKKINKLIKKYYVFMGYIEFSNLIDTHNKESLKKEFQDRMIVIDEIHNIRTTKEGNEQNDMQKSGSTFGTLGNPCKIYETYFSNRYPDV